MSEVAREALADAASTVDDVDCSPYYRQVVQTGAASIRFDRLVRSENGFGSMTTWQCVVWLPKSQPTAEKWIDDHLPDLLEALGKEGVVTAAQPIQMQIDSGTASALVVEVVRGTEE